MKKRLSLILILCLLLALCACKPGGPSSGENSGADKPGESSEASESESSSEDSDVTEVTEVWETVDAGIIAEKTGGFAFGLREDFTDISYRWNEKKQIAEMEFRADGILWTARAARRSKFDNIAGQPFAFAKSWNESLVDAWLCNILGKESIVLENDAFKCGAGAWYWTNGGFMLTLSYFADEYCPINCAASVFKLNTGLPAASETSVSEQNDYPRTDIPVRLEEVYEHLCPSRGDVRMMVVPVSFTDGYEYTDEYFEKVRQKLAGTYPANGDRLSVKDYFLNASYGQLSIDFEILPVVEVGKTAAETEASWQGNGEYGRFYQRVFASTKAACSGDFSVFDSDRDGAVDLLLFIFNDPATGADSNIGTLFGAKTTYNDDFSGTADAPDFRIAMCIEYAEMTDECPSSMKNSLIHEIGHSLGLEDYYSLSRTYSSPSGGFDMQCHDIGDWNAYSKLAVGWIDPYIVEPGPDPITLKLGSSALYPDLILIPAGKGLNGSIFDEYILVDVLSWTGNNRMDWFDSLVYDPYAPGLTGGVRITHVDSRLVKRYWNGSDFAHVLMDDFRSISHDWGTDYTYLHSMTPGSESLYGLPEEDPFAYILHVLEASGSQHILDSGGRLYSSDLFQTGSVFSIDTHAAAFPNAPSMNDGSPLDFEITVDEYDPERMEATITIRKSGVNG